MALYRLHLPAIQIRRWVLGRKAAIAGGASVVGILLSLATMSSVYADCIDVNNAVTYCGSYYGCGNAGNYYMAQVSTQSKPCVWVTQDNGQYMLGENCSYVYTMEGAKGNLSTGGAPYVSDGNPPYDEHVTQWIAAQENPKSCTTANGAPSCWVQVGWEVGYAKEANGCSPQGSIDPTTPSVEVEIYDDSSAPCFLSTFGAAPANASYDARYYTTSGGFYQYNVYFEVPGSNNIQFLAYADFHTLYTNEQASGEAHEDVTTNGNSCPVLGQTTKNEWNQIGQPASQSTFASNMQLYYNGSWVNWTTAYAPTLAYIWPPNGLDSLKNGKSTNPYQIKAISNFGAGNYTQWETGGPQ